MSQNPPSDNASRILLLEDNPADARLIREYLGPLSGGFELEVTDHLSDMLNRIRGGQWDVILCDLSVPDSQGLETFLRIRGAFERGPVIVLSGFNNRQMAIEALQRGAEDYLVKGTFDDELLRRSILYALERRRLRIELEELRRHTSLGHVASAVAHHMNNVLMGVATYTELAVRASDQPAKVDQALDGIRRSVAKGKSLVHEVLSLTRLASPKRQRISLETWIDRLRADLDSNPDTAGVIRSIEVEPGLTGWLDPEQFKIALTHLVRNVKEASPTASARLVARSKSRDLVIEIIDDGPGISPQHLPHVFEPLYSTRTHANGLGLATVRQIALLHGGTADIASTPGEGATVTIVLPLERADQLRTTV